MKLIKKRTKSSIEIIKEFLEEYNMNTDDDYYVIDKKIVGELE